MADGSNKTGGSPSSLPRSTRRAARSVGVAALLVISAFLAVTRNGNADAEVSVESPDATLIAVATNDLVAYTSAQPKVTRVTGGYVPEVGIVLTVEIDELATSDIDRWTAELLRSAGFTLDLGDNEEVIFLLDIARPNRTSRLISITPSSLAGEAPVVGRQAPATSTAPLRATFEQIESSNASQVDE